MTEARIEEIVAALEEQQLCADDECAECPRWRALIADWRAKKAEIERLRSFDPGSVIADRDAAAEAMRAKCQAAVEALHDPQDDGWEDALNAASDAIAALKLS